MQNENYKMKIAAGRRDSMLPRILLSELYLAGLQARPRELFEAELANV